MKILIKIKTVYGNQLFYPVCEKAKLFTQLLGKKTLSTSDLRTIKELGFKIEVASQELKGTLFAAEEE